MKGYYNKYSRKILKSILLVIIIIVNGLFSKSALAYTPETVRKSDLLVDESKFDVDWYETIIIKVYQSEKSKDSDFKQGEYLGYVEFTIGFATEIDDGDDFIDQMILFKAEMHPRYITDTKQSIPYWFTVNIGRNDEMNDAMVCAGSSINEIFGEEATVLYITSIDDNSKLRWDYEYYKRNKDIDKYFYNASELYGIAKWNLNKDIDFSDWEFDVEVVAEFVGGSRIDNSFVYAEKEDKALGKGIGRTVINMNKEDK